MRTIIYYKTEAGTCPAKDFINGLEDAQIEAVFNNIGVVRDLETHVPRTIFKKITADLWEIITKSGGLQIRILSFFDGGSMIVLASGFVKKTKKTPLNEIRTAEMRRKDYLKRK